MRESTDDLWTLQADARCIPINGSFKAPSGELLARGLPKAAIDRYANLEKRVAGYLVLHGNHTGVLIEQGEEASLPLVVLPVRHAYEERADLALVRRSLSELVLLTTARGWQTVVLPRVGCAVGKGYGIDGLVWERVGRMAAPMLDDRFVVVAREMRASWKKRLAEQGHL